MDRVNHEKMRTLIYELSNKNELLNNNNNDLNVKVLSLTNLVKRKDTKINIINSLLIKKALKNLFFKKYIKEYKSLLNAFTNLKYFKKKKYLQPKLYYDHDIFFYILSTNKNNVEEKGVGDYSTNLKLYRRRQTCITFLKKRKYNNNQNQNDISNIEKSFFTINNNISCIDTKKKFFENISPQNNVESFYIKSIDNNSKLNYSYKLKINNNINYNIINNHNNNYIHNNKDKKLDFSVSHFKILCNKKNNFFDNKKLIIKNSLNFSFLYNNNINNYKIEIEKYKMQEELYKKIEQENKDIKNELIQRDKNINDMKIICQNHEFKMNEINKKNQELQDELIKMKTEINNYKEIQNKEHENKIIFSFSKLNFSIISNNIKTEKLNILNNNYKNLSKSDTINYNIIALDNTNIDKDNHEFIIINQEQVYFPGNISFKKEIISNFENAIQGIENKNNLFKLLVFETKLNQYIIHLKYFFYIKFLHHYYNKKIKYTFDSMRNILILLKLKQLIKYFPSNIKKFSFYKYYIKCISISFKEKKNKLSKYKHKNEELEQKLYLFSDTFRQYEQSHKNEEEKKNNELSKYKSTINNLNIEIEKMKNYEKESREELNNNNNNQKKIIDGLNEEINELKKSKTILENKILSQQELIKNINTKMQQCQEENEQNEQNYNSQIEQVQSKFDEYETNINELNNEKNLLIKDNEKMKITIENLNKSNEKLFDIVKNSKNYEIENQSLLRENNLLKEDNEILNNKYIGLKEDFDNLKSLSEESKNELTKAMHEMELYSQLLQTLENKVTIAENDKRKALKERDKAVNDVKALRQRYINIMGDGFI